MRRGGRIGADNPNSSPIHKNFKIFFLAYIKSQSYIRGVKYMESLKEQYEQAKQLALENGNSIDGQGKLYYTKYIKNGDMKFSALPWFFEYDEWVKLHEANAFIK